MSLKDLLDDENVRISDIATYLDELSAEARADEVLELSRGAQIALWERAAESPPITLEHFVPAGTPPLTEVIHEGRNTLPTFKRFQKRFAVQAAGDREAIGYNEGSTRALIGPGFFVAEPTHGKPEWEERGAVVVNYFRVPEGPVVETWPKVVPNSRGLQMFVYNKTLDFMRRVSTHVSIGAAFKHEKPLGAYFVLVREPEA